MDLYNGLPYWIVKDSLSDYCCPLQENIKTEVAIIGSGITGALIADEFCRAGIECCCVDKRSLSTGSSCASTALLQYEIDVPLCEMAKSMPEDDAVLAYRSCLESIPHLESILAEAYVDASFENVPSIYLASNSKGLDLIKREYAMRKKHGLPTDFLDSTRLKKRTGIDALGALMNDVSAQMDAYKGASGLLLHDMKKYGLRVFSHTDITEWNTSSRKCKLISSEGKTITCNHIVIAAGFEAGPFLPRKAMKLTSTFAIVSQPIEEPYPGNQRCLIWETARPYLYIRTDDRNRIIVGGEDINLPNNTLRKYLIEKKARKLERKFKVMFPEISFVTEMAWAGVFSSTRDGLPLIGAFENCPRILYALGYGGNGITFSVCAAQILKNIIKRKKDNRARIFSPERQSLK